MYQVQHKRAKFVGPVFLTVFSTYLNIPVLVEIVDTCDEAAIAVRVVDMSHVPCPVTRVTSNHSLPKNKERVSGAKIDILMVYVVVVCSFKVMTLVHALIVV